MLILRSFSCSAKWDSEANEESGGIRTNKMRQVKACLILFCANEKVRTGGEDPVHPLWKVIPAEWDTVFHMASSIPRPIVRRFLDAAKAVRSELYG